MFAKPKIAILILIILLTSGCTGVDTSSDEAVMQPLFIQITPALSHWLPEINTCMAGIPDAALKVDILPYDYLDYYEADLIIRLGRKEPDEQALSILGFESIIFITNTNNPLPQISTQSLTGILEGSLTDWSQLPEFRDNGLTYDQEITLFNYGESNDLSRIITSAFLESSTLTENTWYVASGETMLDSIQKMPGAIGYVLESQVSESIKSVEISELNLLTENLRQPVLAITKSDPTRTLLQLLLCLQGAN